MSAKERIQLSDDDASMYAQTLELGTSADEFYVAMRRLLLYRKAQAGTLKRQSWQKNGAAYPAYRDYLKHVKQTAPSPVAPKKKDVAQPRAASAPSPPESLPAPAKARAVSEAISSTAPPEKEKVKEEQTKPFAEEYCSFEDCKVSVNLVKFARRSTSQLAYATSSGMLRICTAAQPAVLQHDLTGHTKEVTDFDWSSDNDYLCSSSKDKSVRVWDASTGTCIRIVYGTLPVLGIRFHPWLVGGASSAVHVLNFSTGRVVSKLAMEQRVTCMDTDAGGRVLFAADAVGTIHSLEMDALKGTLVPRHKSSAAGLRPTPATSLHLKPFSQLANGPLLLAYTRDGSLRLFTSAPERGQAGLVFHPTSPSKVVKSLPRETVVAVTGGDDFRVYFYDFSRRSKPLVGKLQGHRAPVVDVCWNHGGTLLASADTDGRVIVWKKDENV